MTNINDLVALLRAITEMPLVSLDVYDDIWPLNIAFETNCSFPLTRVSYND